MKKRIYIILIISSIFIIMSQYQFHQLPNYPESFMIETPNTFDYQPGLECSAFASAYLLRHYGREASGLQLFENFPGKLAQGGVTPMGIEQFFKEQGFECQFVKNGTIEELKAEISKGAPVIVFIHVEEPYTNPHNTHYVPLVGYDENHFYFAESLIDFANCKDQKNQQYNRQTKTSKFKKLWKNIDATWDYPYFRIQRQN